MMNKSKLIRFLSLSLAVAGFVFASGHFSKTSAQTRDPFEKPGWAKPKVINPTPTGTTTTKTDKPLKPVPPAVVVVGAPAIEQRIAYYKRMREQAVQNNQEVPKVTSVLTLDEMAVIGIFRTPRGYAAMVEAKPIKLSYTVYPGEKFFDGQLVAIEENRLVFRKITKMSNSKFVSTVENKSLREYTIQEEVQGTAPVPTAPVQTQNNTETATTTTTPATTTTVPVQVTTDKTVNPVVPSIIISPLDEMNKQPTEQPKDSADKKSKKTTKVAKNKK
ncbi:MAG: hypothetical protein WA584_01460 [Pyrinomonadaceae bacterium]